MVEEQTSLSSGITWRRSRREGCATFLSAARSASAWPIIDSLGFTLSAGRAPWSGRLETLCPSVRRERLVQLGTSRAILNIPIRTSISTTQANTSSATKPYATCAPSSTTVIGRRLRNGRAMEQLWRILVAMKAYSRRRIIRIMMSSPNLYLKGNVFPAP